MPAACSSSPTVSSAVTRSTVWPSAVTGTVNARSTWIWSAPSSSLICRTSSLAGAVTPAWNIRSSTAVAQVMVSPAVPWVSVISTTRIGRVDEPQRQPQRRRAGGQRAPARQQQRCLAAQVFACFYG